MPFALNKEKMLLKEPFIEVGTVASPGTLDVSTTDPDTIFTTDGRISYVERGTVEMPIDRTFAEFTAGTPFVAVRHDLTGKDYRLRFNVAQWQLETLELLAGFEITSNVDREVVYFGHDEPVQALNAFRLTFALVDGTVWKAIYYAGKVITEGVGPTFTGDAHAMIPVEIRMFLHSDFEATANDTQDIGVFWTELP